MANPEPFLGPRKTMFILVIVVGCFAVLWPRILYPLFVGNVKQQIQPNQFDKQTGCCDMIFETDINAITIISEVCGYILQKQSGQIDDRTKLAFSSGKLPKDIITMCRQEVNATCGIDIATFLGQNVRLGKSYKQILEEVRSYNGSNCLKSHFGVPTWALGGGSHVVANSWVVPSNFENIKQERPLQLGVGTPHPAIRERGRAIVPDTHTVPPRAAPQQRTDGRPIPIPGVRPPMGGAGGVVPPPKSSMGFFMPVYTICIVVFFMYTLCKILFRKTSSEQASPYEEIKPDPLFRRRVFDDGSERSTPDTRLGDEELDMLKARLAETERAMERIVKQLKGPLATQEPITNHNHANGNVHSPRHEQTPVRIIAQELPPTHKETPRESTPEPKESTPEPKVPTPEPKEPTPEPEAAIPDSNESAPEVEVKSEKPQSDGDKESFLNVQKAIETTATIQDIKKETKGKSQEQESDEELSEEEIEYDDEEDVEETPAVKQFRDSVERENATVKVLGMEMTAHCESGTKWGDSAGAVPAPPPAKKLPPPPAEVSSIYLEGSLPHQSRLLVTDSETHREDLTTQGKDSPIVLSGKMTLSLINDESVKASPERDSEEALDVGDDDDFTTASATTAPKQVLQNEENASEEEGDLDDLIDDILRSDDEVLKSDDEIFKSDDEMLKEDKDKSQKVTDILELSNEISKTNIIPEVNTELIKSNEDVKNETDKAPKTDVAESHQDITNTIDEIPETLEEDHDVEIRQPVSEELESVETSQIDNEESKAVVFKSVYEMLKSESEIPTTEDEVDVQVDKVLKSRDELPESNNEIIKSVVDADTELSVNKDDATLINDDEIPKTDAQVFISVYEMPKSETESSANKDEVKESDDEIIKCEEEVSKNEEDANQFFSEVDKLNSETSANKDGELNSVEDNSTRDVEVIKAEEEINQSLDKVSKTNAEVFTSIPVHEIPISYPDVPEINIEIRNIEEVPKISTEESENIDEIGKSIDEEPESNLGKSTDSVELSKTDNDNDIPDKNAEVFISTYEIPNTEIEISPNRDDTKDDVPQNDIEVTESEEEIIQSVDEVQKPDEDEYASKEELKSIDVVPKNNSEVRKEEEITSVDDELKSDVEISPNKGEELKTVHGISESDVEKLQAVMTSDPSIIKTENDDILQNNAEIVETNVDTIGNIEPESNLGTSTDSVELNQTDNNNDIPDKNAEVFISTYEIPNTEIEISPNSDDTKDDVPQNDIEVTESEEEIIQSVDKVQKPDVDEYASKEELKSIVVVPKYDSEIRKEEEIKSVDDELKSDVEISRNKEDELNTVHGISDSDVEVLQAVVTSDPSIIKTENDDILQNNAEIIETNIDTIGNIETVNENDKAQSKILKSDDEFVKIDNEETNLELLSDDDKILTDGVKNSQRTDETEMGGKTEGIEAENEEYEEIIHIGNDEGKNTEVVLLPDGKIILPDGTILESDPELLRDGYEVLGLNDMVYVVDFDVDGNEVIDDDDDFLENMEILRNHPDVVRSVDDIIASAAQVVESRNQMLQMDDDNVINEILEDDDGNLSTDDGNVGDDTPQNANAFKPVHEQAKVSEVALRTNEDISNFGVKEVKPNPVVVLQATEMEDEELTDEEVEEEEEIEEDVPEVASKPLLKAVVQTPVVLKAVEKEESETEEELSEEEEEESEEEIIVPVTYVVKTVLNNGSTVTTGNTVTNGNTVANGSTVANGNSVSNGNVQNRNAVTQNPADQEEELSEEEEEVEEEEDEEEDRKPAPAGKPSVIRKH